MGGRAVVTVAAYSETFWFYQLRHWAPLTLSEEWGHQLNVLLKGGQCLELAAGWGRGGTPGERESKTSQVSGMSQTHARGSFSEIIHGVISAACIWRPGLPDAPTG